MDIIVFRNVFNNILLNRIIFKYVHHIYIDILKVKKTIKWNEVIESACNLAGNGYLNRVKEYYRINNRDDKKFNRKVLFSAIKSHSLDIVKFIIEELHFDFTSTIYITNPNDSLLPFEHDLLFIASKYGDIDIVKYIESLNKYKLIRNKDSNNSNSSNNNIFYNSNYYYHYYSFIFQYKFKKLIEKLWLSLKRLIAYPSNTEVVKHIEPLTYNNNNKNKYTVNWNYIETFSIAALSKDIKVPQFIYDKIIENLQTLDDYDIESAILVSLAKGKLDFLEWLVTLSKKSINLKGYKFVRAAIKSGKVDILQFCFIGDSPQYLEETNFITYSAKLGHLDIMKWLHKNNISGCTKEAMDYAASCGYFEIVKWLHENRTEGCTRDAINNAVLNGDLEMVKWLHENRTEGCSKSAMDSAASIGNLEIIKWLHENRTEGCSVNAMENSASIGNLEIIKWLHENRTEGCTTYAMDYAAKNGHLETLKWLHENRTEGCSAGAMDKAAKYGHLETVKWLHENRTEGCTTDAMDRAATFGHFEIVKWLHENRTEGCTTDAIDGAASGGYLEIIKWLNENRTEGYTIAALDNAYYFAHWETKEYLENPSQLINH